MNSKMKQNVHMGKTCSRQNLCNKEEEEDLAESIGVVSAKYPPKVKLENFHNSRVPKLG